MRHTEALLFVDDQQPEVLELDVLGEQPVRADDDVDLAGGEVFDDLILLLLRAEAAHHVDGDRKPGEAFGERLLVLKREDGGRREKRRLASRP